MAKNEWESAEGHIASPPKITEVDDKMRPPNKRVLRLIEQHKKLIADGYLPTLLNELPERGTVDCWVCDYHNLLWMLMWQNRKTGEMRYTGTTCFRRVMNQIDLPSAMMKILHWAATNTKKLRGIGPFSLPMLEFERILSYEDPLRYAYSSDWESVSKNIWEERDRFTLDPLELGVVRTLVLHEPPYWRGSPTPRQRELLNAALRHVNEQAYDEWGEDVESAAS